MRCHDRGSIVGFTLLASILVSGAPVVAQDTRVVQVRVTSVSGRSIYLDVGRGAGLAPGQEIELLPPNGAPFRVPIREVSATSARAEVPPGRPLVPPGTVGEVTISTSVSTSTAPRRADENPEHPPWAMQDFPSGQTADPLLAPAFGGGPASRPVTLHGRLFGQLDYSHDSTGEGYDAYRARLGARFDLTNPLGYGGRLGFDGEVSRRSVDLFDSGEVSDDRARIDRLSYADGDDDLEPWRYEIGRFTSQHVPELGLIDGVEVLHRTSHSVSIGGGAGAFPLPFPDRKSGDDYGGFAFLRWQPEQVADDPASIGGTIGFQKTWHEGSPDRDLLFARFDWSPSRVLRFDASALVDYYTGSDDLKSSGLELTQAWLSATWNATDQLGLGLSASTYRWAQLLREDFAFAPPELIQDGLVQRVSPRAWFDLTDEVRLNARTDLWSDQTRSGSGGELGFDWRRAFGSGFDFGLSGFVSEGSYLSGPGARARVSHGFDWGYTGLRYELTQWTANGLATGDEQFTQHRIGVDLDLILGDRWNMLVNGDVITGDSASAYTAGLFVQRRF